jgi:hypothetical protein
MVQGSMRPALMLMLLLSTACSRTSEPPKPGTSEPRNPGTPEPRNLGTSEPRNPGTPFLQPGDPVPAAVLAGARHWAREGVAGNRILVITFGRTRCAPSEPCAAVENKLRSVQQAIRSSSGRKPAVGLVTLSVDPSFDMPAVLRAHADRVGADAEIWRFAALPATQVDEVLAKVGASRTDATTLVVDADGKLAKVYAGDAWSADDLARDVESLALRTNPAVVSAYIAAQEALAADDAGAARRELARLKKAIGEPAVSRLAAAAASAGTLTAMRAAFKPLSEALVRLPWPPPYQPMYCPMFDSNAGATWVQRAGPVANPYYGREMLRCGTDLSVGAHADHSPRHAGVLFMAPDAFHHVEGTYTEDGVFRVYIDDNFRKPMQASGFRARVEIGDRSIRLAPAADGLTLAAKVGGLTFPAEITLWMVLDPRGSEERFDFVFASYSQLPEKK